MYTFDGVNKLIILDAGVTSFVVGDLYSRWKDWVLVGDNAKYEPAFANSVGGNPLGGGTSLGSYFFLQNGWVIRPQEADHVLTVSGNLFPIPESAALFTPPLGTFTVAINLQTSSLTQAISTNGSTITVQQIWDAQIDNKSARDRLKDAEINAANAMGVSAGNG